MFKDTFYKVSCKKCGHSWLYASQFEISPLEKPIQSCDRCQSFDHDFQEVNYSDAIMLKEKKSNQNYEATCEYCGRPHWLEGQGGAGFDTDCPVCRNGKGMPGFF